MYFLYLISEMLRRSGIRGRTPRKRRSVPPGESPCHPQFQFDQPGTPVDVPIAVPVPVTPTVNFIIGYWSGVAVWASHWSGPLGRGLWGGAEGFEDGDCLADLGEVGRAAVAFGQVPLDLRALEGVQHAVEVVSDQVHQGAAVDFSGVAGCRVDRRHDRSGAANRRCHEQDAQ